MARRRKRCPKNPLIRCARKCKGSSKFKTCRRKCIAKLRR